MQMDSFQRRSYFNEICNRKNVSDESQMSFLHGIQKELCLQTQICMSHGNNNQMTKRVIFFPQQQQQQQQQQ